jgi:hypothetical protein
MSIAFAQLPSEINHKESRTNALSLTDELMALLTDRYTGEENSDLSGSDAVRTYGQALPYWKPLRFRSPLIPGRRANSS